MIDMTTIPPAGDETPADDVQRVAMDFSDNSFVEGNHRSGKEWIQSAVRIAEKRATTRNSIAIILVIAFVASFPAYCIALYFLPQSKQDVNTGFTQWLVVIGSLTGAAVGVGSATAERDKGSV